MTEKQPMAGLKLLKVPVNYDPIQAQKHLQLRISERNYGKPGTVMNHCPAFTLGELLGRLRFNHEADAAEKIEMLEWLPWKAWKTYPDTRHTDPVSDLVKLELKYELIDRFHFMLNEAIALDMAWEEFMAILYTKQQENIRRQNEGY